MDLICDPPSHPALAGLRAANEDLDKAARSELWQLLDQDVEAALDQLQQMDARAAALRGRLLREADTRSLRERTAALSTGAWLADRFNWSRSRATRELVAATAAGRHPQVEAALADGAMSTEQAAVVTAALDRLTGLAHVTDEDLAASADLLVDQAAALDPRRLTVAARELVERLAARAPSNDDPADEAAARREEEAAEAAAARAEINRLSVRNRPDGGVRGSFDISPVAAAIFAAWLAVAGRRHPGADGLEDARPMAQRRGDALVDALAAHLGVQPTDTASRQGSAFDGTAVLPFGPEHPSGTRESGGAAAAASGGLAPTVAPAVQIGITIGMDALRRWLSGAGLLDTGGTISAAELRRLACDAQLLPIVLGGSSQVLDVGRATRTWTPAQRRAVIARDTACSAPGCDRPPAACQIHHRDDWANGGPTDVDHGVLLCLFHHQQVHRQGWRVVIASNGYPAFIPPTTIDPEQTPRQHHRYRLVLLTQRRRS